MSLTTPSFSSLYCRALFAAAVLAIFFAGPLAAEDGLPRAAPEEMGMSSARLDRLSAVMQDHIDRGMLAGTVTLVARGGKVVHFEAQGHRYREENEPMTTDSIFVIMSMTKPIVTVALMTLYEEGHFLLDDPISKWLPEYKEMEVLIREEGGVGEAAIIGREPAARPLTIRHVLTHTSGLSTRPRDHGLTPQEMERFSGGRAETVAEAIERAAIIPLSFHPGDEWQYGSSTDYVARLVEVISGQSMDVFLRERVLEPLGMLDTHYNVPESKVGRVAAVYSPTGEGRKAELRSAPQYREPRRYFGGVAGLSSTAHDYFRFAQMMLNGGELDGVRILSPKTVDLMITNQTADKPIYIRGDGYGFGLGFSVLTDPAKAKEPLSPGSFSWGGAWGTIFWIDPAEQMIGVFMTQISSYRHLNVRQYLAVMATQAVTESWRHRAPTVMGYERLP